MEDIKEEICAETSADSEAVTASEEIPKKEKKMPRAKTGDTAKIEKLKKELEASQEAYTRVLAEYANYKRRTEQEKENLGAFTRAETVKQLLPALDNLDRALDAPAGEEYKAGMDMTIRQLKELLQKMGLEEIGIEGEPFDPEIHNAVMREDADGVDTETVTAVFQKGYRLGGRLLRPAMVKVAN